MQTFKTPLSIQEESQYLRQFHQGNQTARDCLIEHNMRLVAHIVKKYINSAREPEDLLSIGTIGLIKAVNTYNEKKGSRLVTYAAKCIENEILMHLRTEKKHSREVSLYEPIGTDKEGNEINLSDIIETEGTDTAEFISTLQDIEYLKRIFDHSLKNREAYIIRMRYGLDDGIEHTQKEIGQQLGISRSYVSRIEKSALLKLRGEFLRRK